RPAYCRARRPGLSLASLGARKANLQAGANCFYSYSSAVHGEQNMTYRKSPGLMWMEAMSMLDQADRLHRQFFQLSRSKAHGPIWEPPADIFETADHISVLVALPGVTSDRLEVMIDSGTL